MSNPCGGCGAKTNRERCIGCLHDFETPESSWVKDIFKEKQVNASIPVGSQGTGAQDTGGQGIDLQKMKIYVASSWRNDYQQDIVKILRREEFDVYDFRNPVIGNHGFASCDYASWMSGTVGGFNEAMKEPEPALAFKLDSQAVAECNVCLMVLPCGKSAHMEMGWAAGNGKTVIVYSPPELKFQPELMYGWADFVSDYMPDVIEYLGWLAVTVERRSETMPSETNNPTPQLPPIKKIPANQNNAKGGSL